MTPREWSTALEGITAHRRDEYERDISLAWYTAAFSAQAKAGKLKSLREILTPHSIVQSRETQLAMLKLLSEQMGIPLKVH